MRFISLATICGIFPTSRALISLPGSLASLQQPLQDSRSHRFDLSDIPKSSFLSFHRKIVEIKSISDDETDVGEYIVQYLKDHHFTVRTQKVPHSTDGKKRSRFNILAYPPGYSSPNDTYVHTLMTSHIDTVPPFIPYSVAANPTSPNNPTISGRGTVDAKACVAAQTHTLLNLLSLDTPSGQPEYMMNLKKKASTSTALLFVVGEETLGDGMRYANNLNLTFNTVIFGEPTEGKLATGHKGILGFTLHAKGKAAHSGYPWLGISANSLIIKALSALEALQYTPEEDGGLPSSKKYGNSTLNIGLLEGGVAANVVASTASARVAIRLSGGTPEQARSALNKTIHAIDPENLTLEYWGPGYGPIDIDSDVKGFDKITVNYGTDIPNLDYDGSYKRYLYGPGSILVAHGNDEALTVEDLEGAVEGYTNLLIESFQDN